MSSEWSSENKHIWEPFGEPMNPFTLTYRGPLPPSANKSAKKRKGKDPDERKRLLQAMRRTFHVQLRDVWENNEPLTRFCHNGRLNLSPFQAEFPNISGSGSHSFYTRRVRNFDFAPLVINGGLLKLICELTIKLLWRDDPGSIVNNNGDIDNRIKPLFDALTVPQADQLPTDDKPSVEESPLLVLLDDDKFITKVSIATERLHRPQLGSEEQSEIELDIQVLVKASSRSKWKWPP